MAANGSIFIVLGEQIPSILSASAQTVLLTGHQNPWWPRRKAAKIVREIDLQEAQYSG